MEKSKVYYTSMRTGFDNGLLDKLKRLIKKAGIENIDFDGKYTAIKMHFGEPGNLAFLRPNYAKVVADTVKELGGKPFLTDCNTLYVGGRKNALDHIESAYVNGTFHRLPYHYRRWSERHGRSIYPCRRRRICKRGKNRTCDHGCGCVYLSGPL